MTEQQAPLSEAALVQQQLWGTDPQGWAQHAEPHNRGLFEALLDATAVGTGTRLLDVGCGSGLTLVLAAQRGAVVVGIDVSPGLLDVARSRLPQADLRVGDLQTLPFDDGSADVVLGVNAFQFAADPPAALVEAARVVRDGGFVGVSLFAEPERCESTAVHEALAALSPPERQSVHQPYALSEPGNLEAALDVARLAVRKRAEVAVVWQYDSVADAVRGLLSSGGGARAAQDVGRDAVADSITAAVAPFTSPDGVVAMRNVFRYVVAERQASL